MNDAVAVVALGWERIQLVIRLRGTAADARGSGLRLECLDAPEPLEAMPPTNASADGAETRLRFNVMLGPGQRPLASGAWTLTRDAVPVRVDAATVLEAARDDRLFAYRGGTYRVAPGIAEDGTLRIQVEQRRSGRSRSWRKRVRSWLKSRVKVRQRLFDALVSFFRSTSRRTGRRVVFTSDSRAGLEGNLAVVHARMIERGLDRDHELRMIFKPSIAARRSWRDRWRLPRLLARADVILVDDFQPVIYRLPPDPSVRIVQLWHASGAFKTVGYSRIGKPGGPSPFARRHKNYTHAIVSGGHDIPFYAEAFGLPEERVVPTGIPRMDRFFDDDQRRAGRELARRLFPAIDGRRTILFAPTFRGNGPRSATYDYGLIDFGALHAVCEAKDAVVIMKMHPFVREPVPIPAALRDRIIDGTRVDIDVNDLLFAVDLLITDYSSIVFEYSTLGRPMLFFAYDLEEYVASRDFYVPFEEFVPGRIARTFTELLDAIRSDAYEVEKVAAFASRHFDHLDGSATDRVIDELILAR